MSIRSAEVLFLYRGKISYEDSWIIDPESGDTLCEFMRNIAFFCATARWVSNGLCTWLSAKSVEEDSFTLW